MMIRKSINSIALMVFAAMLLLAAPSANADSLTLALTNASQTAAPGSTLSFSATATVAGTNMSTVCADGNPVSTVFCLNSIAISSVANIASDDSPFYTTWPLSLGDGETFGSVLFSLNLGSGLAPGTYHINFDLLGGA